ncbi:uncharacterized protein V6R79_003804 [Siganus canaliculatus]
MTTVKLEDLKRQRVSTGVTTIMGSVMKHFASGTARNAAARKGPNPPISPNKFRSPTMLRTIYPTKTDYERLLHEPRGALLDVASHHTHR